MAIKNILSIVLMMQIVLNMTRSILTLFALSLGASTFEIGLLTSAYAVVPLVVAVHAGKIADRIGDRLPVALGMAGMMAGMAVPFLSQTLWALMLSQVIVGTSQIFLAVSLQNVLGIMAPSHRKDHYFSMFTMVVAVGGVIGPGAGGFLAERFSYSSVFLLAALAGLLPLVLSYFIPVIRRGNGQDIDTKSGLLLDLLKKPPIAKALLSSSLVVYSRDVFVAYFPLLAVQMNLSDSMIGWMLSIQSAMIIAVRLYLGRLVAAFGRNRVLFISVIVTGASFALIPFAGHWLLIAVLSGLMGAGLGCGQPISMTAVYQASPASRTGEVLGLRIATNRFSQLIAPLFFGLIGSWAGIISVFCISGAFLAGGAFAVKSDSED